MPTIGYAIASSLVANGTPSYQPIFFVLPINSYPVNGSWHTADSQRTLLPYRDFFFFFSGGL
jgi:hypothetical protein